MTQPVCFTYIPAHENLLFASHKLSGGGEALIECTAAAVDSSLSGPLEGRRSLGTVFWCLSTDAAPTERERVQTENYPPTQRPHTSHYSPYRRISRSITISNKT